MAVLAGTDQEHPAAIHGAPQSLAPRSKLTLGRRSPDDIKRDTFDPTLERPVNA